MAVRKTTKPAPAAKKAATKPAPPMVSTIGQKKNALAKRVTKTAQAGGRQIGRK